MDQTLVTPTIPTPSEQVHEFKGKTDKFSQFRDKQIPDLRSLGLVGLSISNGE